MSVGVYVESRGGDGIDEKRPELVPHVDAVVPQVRFADESFGEADPILSAD